MASMIVIYSDSSSDSVKEIEPPKKLPPPLINIDVDEIVLNVTKNSTQSLARNPQCNGEIPQESSEDNPTHWTDDMKKFYNDDWGDEETFTVETLQKKMDKYPYLWQVSQKDLIKRSKKRDSYVKCLNCCQFGHNMYKCQEPLRLPKCYMCGQTGHLVKRCPNSICLNCGNQVGGYVKQCSKCTVEQLSECLRCSLPGHHFINCTDNWRRFHSTVGKIETDVPKSIIYKSASDVWCCNCGKQGHYEIDCKTIAQRDFPKSSPFVASYDNVFIAEGGNFSVPAPLVSRMGRNLKQRQRKGWNHFQGQQKQNKSGMSFNKLQQVKKHKKRKWKREKVKNRNQILESVDFIPI